MSPGTGGQPLALTVVICTTGRATVVRAAASAVEAVQRSGAEGEVLVVWQSQQAPPPMPGARVLPVLDVCLSHARNRGLDAARGRVVGFVDDDEVVGEDWATAVLAAFAEQPRPDAVFGAVAPLDDVGIPYCVQEGDVRRRVPRGTAPWTVGTGGNMAFDAAALREVGGFDLTFGAGSSGRSAEDTEVIWRLLEVGAVVVREPAAVVYHPSKTEAERLAARHPYGFGAGRTARRHRSPRLAARYAAMCCQSWASGVRQRSPRRRREAARTLRGFLAGALTGSPDVSPLPLLALAPPSVRPLLSDGAEPLPVGYRARPHFLYRVPAGLLHAYVGPDPELAGTLEVREELRRHGLSGVPALLAWEAGPDSLWVVEEELRGTHPAPEDAAAWWPLAVGLLHRLSSARGGPLEDHPHWQDRVRAVLATTPPDLAPRVADAAERLGALASVVVHGDLQLKNLLLHDGALAAIDWEYARAAGLPGHDLLFLAHTTGGPGRLRGLLRGRAPGLADDLAAVGLPAPLHADAVLWCAADWAHDEQRHRALGGARQDGRRSYADLLDAVASGADGAVR